MREGGQAVLVILSSILTILVPVQLLVAMWYCVCAGVRSRYPISFALGRCESVLRKPGFNDHASLEDVPTDHPWRL